MDADTADEIMAATGRALREHGYADLTMQRIADESTISKAALHYHFDTKESLLDAFLDDLVERFEARLACDAEDPRERLATFLSAVFTPTTDSADEFSVALMELKAQAPYHDLIRTRFRDLDEVMQATVADAVEDGIEAGYFDEADPAEVARLVTTAINGSHVRKVALGEDDDDTRRVVERYLELQLGWSPESSSEVVA